MVNKIQLLDLKLSLLSKAKQSVAVKRNMMADS